MSIPSEAYFEEGTNKIEAEDVKKVLSLKEKILAKIRKSPKLAKWLNETEILFHLIGDYWSGVYREIPYRSIAAITFTLFYVLNLLDFVPDFVPGIGFIDDFTVIGMCMKMVSKDIANYKTWRVKHKGE